VARDGSLLMADDANGVIYRISYQEKDMIDKPTQSPATAMESQARQGSGVPLALQRAGANARNQIKVNSPAIHGTIQKMQSEYGDGVSPELWWDQIEGAKSYALIVEDPDAKSPTPFVHWVAYNIPADRTSLPEGLQEQERLTEPEGLLQGRTSKGNVGYFGPRPPVGDPPHHYHFQVFALDIVPRFESQPGRAELLDKPLGLLLEISVQPDEPLDLRGNLVAELIHACFVVPAQRRSEIVPADVDRCEMKSFVAHAWRAPNRMVPSLTIVAPSSTAIS